MKLQSKWRIVGCVLLACCIILAYGSTRFEFPRLSLLNFALYWSIFLICMILALLIAIWDIRYIRAEFRIQERKLFREVLGNKDFRDQIRESERNARGTDKD